MIPQILDRWLGRWSPARKRILDPQITALTTLAYAAGDVMTVGGVPLIIQCASISVGAPNDLVQLNLWEFANTGVCIKPALKIHFFKYAYAVPAQRTQFLAPNTYNGEHILTVDIAPGDWVEHSTLNTKKIAVVHKKIGFRLCPAENSRHVHMVICANGIFTFAASATLTIHPDLDM